MGKSGKLLGIGALILAALLALSSCGTLTKTECLASDWDRIGQRDGRNGAPLSRLESHATTCKKHGIVPNKALYKVGRLRGLKTYCTLDNAFYQGESGRHYHGVCSGKMRTAFDEVYRAAYKIVKLDWEIRDAEAEISTLISSLSKEGLSADAIRKIQYKITSLNRDIQTYQLKRAAAKKYARKVLAREKARLG